MRLPKSGLVWFVLSGIVAMVAVPFSTYADGVPSAVISASAAGGPSISTVGMSSGSECIPESFCQNSSVSVSYADGNASLSGSASMACSGGAGSCNLPPETLDAGAQGSATFYFSAVGSKSEAVPLIFAVSGDASADTGSDSTYASVLVSTPKGDFFTDFSSGGGPCGATCFPAFSFSTTYSAIPNSVYVASVSGGGSGGPQFYPGSTLDFSADLMVQIDPTFADASDFNLGFSPLPTSNVPEPASIMLLGTGLLVLVGFSLKRLVA